MHEAIEQWPALATIFPEAKYLKAKQALSLAIARRKALATSIFFSRTVPDLPGCHPLDLRLRAAARPSPFEELTRDKWGGAGGGSLKWRTRKLLEQGGHDECECIAF